jgi:hypothetical protein
MGGKTFAEILRRSRFGRCVLKVDLAVAFNRMRESLKGSLEMID